MRGEAKRLASRPRGVLAPSKAPTSRSIACLGLHMRPKCEMTARRAAEALAVVRMKPGASERGVAPPPPKSGRPASAPGQG